MPIFEYACGECGTTFEKLVRRAADADAIRCPSCGQNRLTQQYSTFAAPSGGKSDTDHCAPAGGCGAGMCQGGMCGMNMN